MPVTPQRWGGQRFLLQTLTLYQSLFLTLETRTTSTILRVAIVGTATLAFAAHLADFPYLFAAASAKPLLASTSPGLSLFQFVQHPLLVCATFWIGLVAHLLWAVGVAPRAAALVSMSLWSSMMALYPHMYGYPDRALFAFCVLIALSPAARAAESNSGLRPTEYLVPVWGRRLVQLQLVIIYTAAGWAKTGETWTLEHTALYFTLSDPTLQHFEINWAPFQDILLAPGTRAVLWWERLFPVLLVSNALRECGHARFIPDLRWLFLGFGIIVHVGMLIFVYVGIFPIVMMGAYCAFLGETRTGARVLEPRKGMQ